MKQILPILFTTLIFVACTNPEQKKTDENHIKPDQAQVLKNAIEEYPDSLLLKEQLIQLYRDSSDYDHAIALTDDVLSKDSLNDRFWDIKATLYFENEDTLNAINAYRTAIHINPLPRYITLLGSLYAQTKNSKALDMADFLLLSKIPETDKEAFFIKGLYYNYTGEYEKAIGFFDKCLNMDYTYMIAYREKGIALYDMGRYEDAVTVLDKAVTLQNNFDEGYYWLGRSLEKLKRPYDAIEEYKNALMYSPDYVEAKAALKRLQAK